MTKRFKRPHESDRFHQSKALGSGLDFDSGHLQPSLGLTDGKEHDDREENPRQANDQKRVTPAKVFANPATGEGSDGTTNRDTQGISGERSRSFGFGEVIRNHGVNGRRAACFANADANPSDQQPPEGLGGTGKHGHGAPDQDRTCHNVFSRAHIRPARNGDACKRVEQRERNATQETQLSIAQLNFCFDGFDQN